MSSKNIILVGAIAIGAYLLLQAKKIPFITKVQKTAQRRSSVTTPTVRQRTAQRIAQTIAQRIAQKVAPKKIGQPTTQAARIAAARKAAALRKAAARKIGKKIGKTVAQNIAQKIKARRAAMARYAKRQRPQIQRPFSSKKQKASKLFPGAEKSRVIPYKESSKHSYYGSKSHKVLNPGYMEKRYKADYNTIEAYDARKLQELLRNRKP